MSTVAPHDPKRFRLGFIWWVAFAAVALVAALIALSLEVREGFAQTRALREEVTRSYETRAELQTILAAHLDLETGQRGFVLTGDRRFLQAYFAGEQSIDASFARLRSEDLAGLTSHDELATLQHASALKRDYAKEMIALVEAGQLERARARTATGEGRRLMDAVRDQIERIDVREVARLAERTRVAGEARRRLQGRIEALQYFLIGLLVVALVVVLRAYRGWERALAKQRDLAARHEAIFAGARDGMLVINESGSVESLNPAAARLFGYDDGELLRRDVGMLFEPALPRGQAATFLKRLAPGAGSVQGNTREFTGCRKDGSAIPVEVSVSPVALGGQMRYLAVVRDVTERKQVDQMKSEFVSTVSHELRTPLTSISGSLGLIAGGAAGELPERARRLVEIAQSNSARLIRLINDILDIEKIESGRMTFHVTAVPLERLLPTAIEAIRPFAATHEVALQLGEVPEGAAVMADEDRLMQVVTNLLSNAAKWSPQGGTGLVSAAPNGRFVRISVGDKGPGIAEEFRTRIFGKFAQADSSDTRQKGGTGLGLSIVREIVERLGGVVGFDTVIGDGTTFHVDLPAAAQADPAVPGEALGRISEAGEPLVLHVDDDPDMLRVVASALEGRAQVHSSPSVIEARAALRRYQFDAVILDLGMADGDGLDLVPLIRRRQSAPIVVFTAQDADPAELEDVDVVLVKSRDSLARLVEEVERLTGEKEEGAIGA